MKNYWQITDEAILDDIYYFLEQLAEVKVENITAHTGLFAHAKADELYKRLDRYRVAAKNVSNEQQTPTNAIVYDEDGRQIGECSSCGCNCL